MKKIKALACLCFAAVLLFAGCADDKSNNASENDTSESLLSEETISGDGDSSAGISVPESTSSDAAAVPAQEKQSLTELDASKYSGAFGTYTTLSDPTTGVPVMDAVLPYGWTAQVQCNWGFVSTSNPCIANIIFTSPDKKATVLIQTTHDYLQSYDTSGLFPHRDYTDTSTYIVHLAYKNAGQVLDMCFNGLLGTGGTVVKEDPVPDEVQSLLDQTAQTYLTTLVNGINRTGGGYGVTAQASGSEGTVSMRRYRYTGSDGQSYLADALAFSVAAEYTHDSYGITFVTTPWTVPVTIFYIAPDEATLEQYRAQFELIFGNCMLRNEFNYLKSVYGNQIRNAVMQQQANSIAAMTEAQAQSYLNDYDSSGYTSDDWANDWSDYIYDRNEYTTADGSTIKAGTEFDTVYQNGDEFYFGSQGSAPFGWEQLDRN